MDYFQYTVHLNSVQTLATAKDLRKLCMEVYEEISSVDLTTIRGRIERTKPYLLNAEIIHQAAKKNPNMQLPFIVMGCVYQIRRIHGLL